MTSSDMEKKRLGYEAVDRFVADGMKIGLGTGSTAIWAVRRVAERFARGELKGICAVTTSLQSDLEARSLGVPVLTLNDAALSGGLDLTIDGADEVDAHHNLIKGGGGALLMEKIVAYASRRFIVIVDDSKLSDQLGTRFAVPVEIMPAAVALVSQRLRSLGATVTLRQAARKAGPVVTDHGNLLLDAAFSPGFDPRVLEDELKLIPGVLDNGLFTKNKPALLIGHPGAAIEFRESPSL